MPKLAAVVDSLDKVAEPLREMYTPSADGKSFVLDTDVTAHPGTLGLRDKNAQLIRDSKTLSDKFKPFEGMEPDAVKAAIDAQAKAEEDKKRREGDFNSLRDQLTGQHKKEKDAWDAERGGLLKVIDKRVADDEARTAIGNEDGNAALLMPHVRSQIKVVKDGEDYIAQVIDPKGVQRFNTKGEPMTIRELVAEMKEKDEYKPAFNAPATSGTGARPNAGRSGSGDIVLRGADKTDHAKYVAAKEEAKKRGVQVVFAND